MYDLAVEWLIFLWANICPLNIEFQAEIYETDLNWVVKYFEVQSRGSGFDSWPGDIFQGEKGLVQLKVVLVFEHGSASYKYSKMPSITVKRNADLCPPKQCLLSMFCPRQHSSQP